MSKARKTRGKRKSVSVAPTPFNGDHGTGTIAAMAGTVVEEITNEKGENPNHVARRLRVERIEDMARRGQISLRQYQAGKELRDAWCGVEKLSSGSELKERVQSSPKPDATIAVQTDAMSRYKHAMDAVPGDMRYVIEHVCFENLPLHMLPGISGMHSANLKVALDRVANKMRY